MTRHCARCGTTLAAGEGRIVAWQETGSGPGLPVYACDGCAPPDDPAPPRPYQPPRAPVGFHNRATT